MASPGVSPWSVTSTRPSRRISSIDEAMTSSVGPNSGCEMTHLVGEFAVAHRPMSEQAECGEANRLLRHQRLVAKHLCQSRYSQRALDR